MKSEVYLWDKYDKIVISNVDWTINKSDNLGLIMPIFCNNLAQPWATELFYSIEKNWYKILYLTAREICEWIITKSYLHNLVHNNVELPKGTRLMCPEGLFDYF